MAKVSEESRLQFGEAIIPYKEKINGLLEKKKLCLTVLTKVILITKPLSSQF